MLHLLQALGWLAATLTDKQLLVTFLDVLSKLLHVDAAQQAQQQISVHANVTLHMHVWTALLQKTLDGVKESDGQALAKVLHLGMSSFVHLCFQTRVR